MAKPTTINVVMTPAEKREFVALAKREKRTLSNMALYLMHLGKDLFIAKEKASEGQAA